MSIAMDAMTEGLHGRLRSDPYGQGAELLSTPWDYPDGETVTLLVRQLGHDHFLVSDRGVAADRLSVAGVDLSTGSALRSWSLIRSGLDVVLAEAGDFEIATTAARESLGVRLWDVASRALQADGLHVLGRARRTRVFPERIMRQAMDAGLAVAPNALLRNRFGGERKVTFKAQGATKSAYIMALGKGGGSFTEDHDRAKMAFADSTLPRWERVVAINPASSLAPWHRPSLKEVATVLDAPEVPDFLQDLAA